MNQKRKKRSRWAMLLAAIFTMVALAPVAGLGQAWAQAQSGQHQITGRVLDEDGQPAVGATVVPDDKTVKPTVTDLDGKFVIETTKAVKLTVGFLGYEESVVDGVPGQNISVALRPVSELLDGVVVVGYGTMRKKDLTGSVAQINPEKIADQNPGTVQDILRGTPGLQIGYDATAKGGGTITLRGQNSLYTSASHNSPLIILDGMQFYGELSEISPDDIAQIDVLKDASSAAVYGAKAASGVIIITTKKGKSGKPVVTLSANMGVNTKAKRRKMYGPSGYLKFYEDWRKAETYGWRADGTWGYYADGTVPVGYYDNPNNLSQYGITKEECAKSDSIVMAEGDTYESLYARRLGLDVAPLAMQNYVDGISHDWEDDTYRVGIDQDYNGSISGANDWADYYFSMGYMKNEGIVKGNDYSAVRASMKINATITKWLEMGVNANFQNRTDGDICAPWETGAYWYNNKTMLFNSPYATPTDKEGNLIQYPMSGSSTNGGINFAFGRPYKDLESGYTVLNTIFNAKVKFPAGITYQFNMAPRLQWYYYRYFESAEEPNSTATSRGATRNTSKNIDWNMNNTLTWDYTFADLHHVVLTAVQEAEENRHWSDKISAKNITPSDVLGFHYIQSADKELSSFSTNDTHSTAAAYMGRLFYGFDDRYMVTATLRRDGYSAFGSSNPWANFWSVGGSWRFSEEKFVNLDWLGDAKLRVSYGTNGNRSLSDTYISLADLGDGGKIAYVDDNGKSSIVNTLQMTRLANPDLEWEKTTAWNIGLDFAVLDNRLSGSVEWYHKKTHDMIMNQRLPIIAGFSSITTNLGEVTNTGIEVSLSGSPIVKDNFRWDVTAGFSWNKNEIKHLYYDYDEETGLENDDTSNGWFIGKPIGEIWTYETCGVWQLDEAEEAQKVGQKPGDPKVVNHYTEDDKEDGTPVYNEKDKVFMGTTQAPFYWNMRHDFTFWKNFSFSFSIYSFMGHKEFEQYCMNNDNGGSMVTNMFNVFEKPGYWTPENPTNDWYRLNAAGPNGIADAVGHVRSKNFARLDNISLGYTLPQHLTQRWSIDRVRVTGAIDNVCTFTKWKYGDPESTNRPAVRSFKFGINVTL